MSVADGSLTRLAFIAESAIGTTPSTPTFQIARYVSETLTENYERGPSPEITGDGNIRHITNRGRMVQGDINTLLSYGTFDTWLESLFRGAWSTNVLKNGVTRKAFTIEKKFDFDGSAGYLRYVGCQASALALTINSRADITANWSFMGLSMDAPDDAIISGATYTAATTTKVMAGSVDVGSLSMSGVDATPKIQQVSLNIANGMYEVPVVTQDSPLEHGRGDFAVTGTITALFRDLDLLEKVKANTELSWSATIGSVTGEKYTLSLPKIVTLNGGAVVGGANGAVLVEVPFQARYDTSSSATMSITRAVS